MEASKFQATHHSYIRKQLLREVKASGLVSRDLVMEDAENVVTKNTQPKSGEKIEVFFVVKGDYNGVRLRVFSRNGPLSISVLDLSSSPMPRRRTSASTRAVSSAGEKGLVT